MMTLLQKTRALAHSYNGNVSELCKEIGVSTRWYYTFINEPERDYGVKKVQHLYEVLTKEDVA